MTNLICLGTVHNDPAGFRRLTRWLETLQPDLILVELSPFGRRFRRRRQHPYQKALLDNLRGAARITRIPFPRALRHPEIAAIRRQIAFPFEYRAARSHAAACRVPLALVDHSLFSMRCILRWPELIAEPNLAHLLTLPIRRLPAANEYRQAQRVLSAERPHPMDRIPTLSGAAVNMWEAREHSMAGRIERWIHTTGASRPVFIGGWRHLAADGNPVTLASLLSMARIQCRLLSDPPVPLPPVCRARRKS